MVEQDQPRKTHVLIRGDYLNRGKPVECGTPESLAAIDPTWPKNRLGLARWLVSSGQPFVAARGGGESLVGGTLWQRDRQYHGRLWHTKRTTNAPRTTRLVGG